ncbi:MAG TPA: hypothetical protein VI757_03885 [Bacteroidia bacterium]|nr:hypothetical protein [Bacteroidia bacterium]
MKRIMLFIIVISLAFIGCDTFVKVTASESDAKIYVNGEYVSVGNTKVKIREKDCQTIRIEKPMYLSEEKKYCYRVQGFQTPPNRDYFTLRKDETFDASVKSDLANVDFNIEVNKKYKEDEVWKTIGQICAGYFDELVNNSRETGFLTTAWKIQSFPRRTIRTRLVVKNSSTVPLAYKVKVVSEIALQEGVSAKDDEKFKEWDRVLKKYQDVISEFQLKLGNK